MWEDGNLASKAMIEDEVGQAGCVKSAKNHYFISARDGIAQDTPLRSKDAKFTKRRDRERTESYCGCDWCYTTMQRRRTKYKTVRSIKWQGRGQKQEGEKRKIYDGQRFTDDRCEGRGECSNCTTTTARTQLPMYSIVIT